MFAFDMNQLVGGIVTKEWEMFLNINGGKKRAPAQEQPVKYFAIRRSYFYSWSREAAYSYMKDLTAAQAIGRNLPREKYIHMMKYTDPKGYGELSYWLPFLEPEREALVNEILYGHLLDQMTRLAEQYPNFMLATRPLRISEEHDDGGPASLESFMMGELLTYSIDTLKLLLKHIIDLENQGIEFVRLVKETTAKTMNYGSLEDAERMYSFDKHP